MSISANELYDLLLDSGIADSPAAELYLEQALEPFVGQRLDVDEFMSELTYESEWTYEAQRRIRSALEPYDGEDVFSVNTKSLISENIRDAILNDQSRWGLTPWEKQAIVNDRALMRRWAAEYSEKEGFNSLLDNVMDDEIYEFKMAHLVKPALDSQIKAAENRSLAPTPDYIILTPNEDRTWFASVSPEPPSGKSARLVQEQSYPVDFYYERTDINGSRVVECDTCNNRDDLLDSLNWLGKCGFSPLKVWDFDSNEFQDETLLQILQDGRQQRAEAVLAERWWDGFDEPYSVMKTIGGMECECFEYEDTGKMLLELSGTFGDGIDRNSIMLVPMDLDEHEMEHIADLWLSEQEKELGLPVGESCSSSGWWAGRGETNDTLEITDQYDHLIAIAAPEKAKTCSLDEMIQSAETQKSLQSETQGHTKIPFEEERLPF